MRIPHVLRTIVCILFITLFSACSILAGEDATIPPIEEQSGLPTLESIPVVTETTSGSQLVTIYVVALEDSGISGKKIGCEDSLVPIEVEAESSLEFPWNAVEALLNLPPGALEASGLYTAFHQADLELVKYETNNKTAQVYLEGELMIGGVCDHPRIEEQLYATILQNEQIEEVDIFINGESLQDYLSLK